MGQGGGQVAISQVPGPELEVPLWFIGPGGQRGVHRSDTLGGSLQDEQGTAEEEVGDWAERSIARGSLVGLARGIVLSQGGQAEATQEFR